MSFATITSSAGSTTASSATVTAYASCTSRISHAFETVQTFLQVEEEEEMASALESIGAGAGAGTGAATLTPMQSELAVAIGQSFRRLRHPDLVIMLPCAELLGHQDQTDMRAAFVSSMEAHLWNVLYLGTSDVWNAVDTYQDINMRLHSVTWLNPEAAEAILGGA